MDEGLLKPGDVLNNTYRIEELVGEGGTGEVYRAINTASQRTVAIKILKSQFSQDPKFIDLMRRELLHNVSDDAVVRYYDLLRTAEDQGGLYFLVMDFIDGPSMADMMRNGPVAVDTLMTLAGRVTQGLAACHAAKIFHRDISPDNIILRGGDPAQATLIDFGIAKDVRPDAKTVVGGGFAGKYEYAAPEQLDGLADARSDIYSFGMTLLAAARGESPKLGTSFLEIVKAKHTSVDTAGVGEPLRSLVDSMVQPAPEDRPQSAIDLLRLIGGGPAKGQGIEALLAPDPSSPAPQPIPKKAKEDAPKKGKGGLIAAVLALCVAGGGAFFALGPGKDLIGGGTLPVATPYMMVMQLSDGKATVTGNAPSSDGAEKLEEALESRLSVEDDAVTVTAATGAPNDAWQSTVTAMAAELGKLEEGSLVFRDDQITLKGVAPTESVEDSVEKTARTIARNGNYRLALTLSNPETAIKAEEARLAREAAEQAEADRVAREEADAARIAEERAAEAAEEARIAAEKAEQDRIEADRLAAAQTEDERLEAERLARERAERDRIEDERRAREKAEAEERRLEQERLAREAEEQRLEEERLAKAAEERERAEREAEEQRLAQEKADQEDADRMAQEQADRAERERLAEEKAEREAAQRLALLEQKTLKTAVVDRVLGPEATCGPLIARPASSKGFDATESIRVSGFAPDAKSVTEIEAALERIAEGRQIDTGGVDVLNPSVCLVINAMPDRQFGPAKLEYYSAKSGEKVEIDALKPDDQAVVYFTAPESMTGSLYVFVTDNEFNSIHLRPMQTRPENDLSKIGTVENGERTVQLTWPLPEGSRKQPVLAFTEPYGISRMFVLVVEGTSLFQHLRAGVEDTRELVPDLKTAIAEARLRGRIAGHIQRFILVDEN